MKKARCWLAAALVSVCALLSGCSLLDGGNLLMLPDISPDQRKLLQLVNSVTANSSWVVTSPSSGDNLSTMQFVDFFGDGISEAVSFFRNSSEMRLRVGLYSKTRSTGYTELCTFQTEGYSVEEVIYSDVDGDRALEILLFVGYESGSIYGVEVYKIRNSSAERIYSGACTAYAVFDMTRDGNSELILHHEESSGGAGNAYAELLTFENEKAECLGYAPVSSGGGKPGSAVCGKLNNGMSGCIFDSALPGSGVPIYVSDVLTWTVFGGFENLSYSDGWGYAYTTLRNTEVFCRDIDFDGFLEIPQTEEMPVNSAGVQSAGSPGIYTYWYGYNADGQLVQKNLTYMFPDGSWYFIMPPSWSGTVYVTTGSMDGLTTLTFSADRNDRSNRLLTIYRTDADENGVLLPEGAFSVGAFGGYSYYALIGLPDELSPLADDMYLSGAKDVMSRFVTVDAFGDAAKAAK